MTAHYARINEKTVRRHWDQARKVDIKGETVTLDPAGPLAEAAWAKQRLGRVTQALPNGYCGLPLQQICPHANACLTCPMFVTTAEFLPQHLSHRKQVVQLISAGEARGQARVVEMNQQVLGTSTESSPVWPPSLTRTKARWPMRADNSHHVIASARRRTEATHRRAAAALRRIDAAGAPVTFEAVAREAGISRSWLYTQPDIRAEIERLRSRQQPNNLRQVPDRQRASDASLLTRLQVATDRIRHLENDNRRLRQALAEALGEQRAAGSSRLQPVTRSTGS